MIYIYVNVYIFYWCTVYVYVNFNINIERKFFFGALHKLYSEYMERRFYKEVLG